MQTLLMTMVLLSLAGALFLLIIFYDMLPGEMELECFSSFTFVFPVESSGIFVRADR